MITDPSGTQTFPNFDPNDPDSYTLDTAYDNAQLNLWSTYLGVVFSWALFACVCVQVYFYYRRFPKDRMLIRLTVAFLFAIEILATTFLTWSTYVVMVRHWGHDIFYAPATWGSMLFDSGIASTVHALYAWRIYKLIARRWLAIASVTLIGLLSLGQFACCVSAAMFNALQYHLPSSVRFVARRLFHGWLASATVADIFITATIALKLCSVRTGLAATDKTINKILYLIVPGGAITAIVTLLILVAQVAWTGQLFYQVLILSLTKFYTNSVLLCLNLRQSQREPEESRAHYLDDIPISTTHDFNNRFVTSIRLDVEKTTDASSTMDSQKHKNSSAPADEQLRIWM